VACLACGATANGWLCLACEEEARGPGFLSLIDRAVAEGYDASFFTVLERLEPQSFWFRGRNSLILWSLGTYFPHARDLLEIGCGTGFVLDGIRRRFSGLDLTGADPFRAGLAVARRRLPGIRLLQLDARDLRFSEAFDVVTAFDVLEHIDDDSGVLERAAHSLRPGGGLIVTVPQHRWLWSAADVAAHHERRYDRGELVSKIENAGLTVVRTTSFVTFPLPLLMAARYRQRRAAAAYDLEGELRLPRLLDCGLELTLAAERALITRGVSFAWGGSLLAVATKP
jgi:SAM-dependent methyltransferase